MTKECDTSIVYPKDANGVFTAGVAGHCTTHDWWGELRPTSEPWVAVRDITVHVRDTRRTKESAA